MVKTWRKKKKKNEALKESEPKAAIEPPVRRHSVRLRKQWRLVQFTPSAAYPLQPTPSATRGLPPKPRKPAECANWVASSSPSSLSELIRPLTWRHLLLTRSWFTRLLRAIEEVNDEEAAEMADDACSKLVMGMAPLVGAALALDPLVLDPSKDENSDMVFDMLHVGLQRLS
ncbi:hypothetical protein AMTR_s00009p00212780 [Amborella trichopoda]|uniref:Uncharacterized protein n=1 Tax=Amborella trichopoda TaxID=13333 RepID=W1NHI5_AMBTC|nr:hypothetical protein AMTR_s00009p00212780 [Amborella trichopoda]